MNLNNVNPNLAANPLLGNNANNNYGNFMRQMYKENANANNPPKFSCHTEGFNNDMRKASGGLEYKKRADHIHLNGEQWTYDELVDFAIDGRIIDWYIEELRKQGIVFTEQEIGRLKSNETLQILSAFFHRYKIVAERLELARELFERSIKGLLPSVRNNHKRRLEEFAAKKINDNEIQAWDLPIERAIENAQCLMFYILKHKGNVPPGFVMDDRIRQRALNPIVLNWRLLDDGYLGEDRKLPPEELTAKRLNALFEWLSFLEGEYRQLSNPPVTFGVFE